MPCRFQWREMFLSLLVEFRNQRETHFYVLTVSIQFLRRKKTEGQSGPIYLRLDVQLIFLILAVFTKPVHEYSVQLLKENFWIKN